jgi:hypothetical protein
MTLLVNRSRVELGRRAEMWSARNRESRTSESIPWNSSATHVSPILDINTSLTTADQNQVNCLKSDQHKVDISALMSPQDQGERGTYSADTAKLLKGVLKSLGRWGNSKRRPSEGHMNVDELSFTFCHLAFGLIRFGHEWKRTTTDW